MFRSLDFFGMSPLLLHFCLAHSAEKAPLTCWANQSVFVFLGLSVHLTFPRMEHIDMWGEEGVYLLLLRVFLEFHSHVHGTL